MVEEIVTGHLNYTNAKNVGAENVRHLAFVLAYFSNTYLVYI